MGRILIAGTASLLICVFLSPRFISFLRAREFGQQIREEGPEGHHAKAGTPTMGGIIIVLALAAPFLILTGYGPAAMGVFGTAVLCGLLGYADDYTKIVKRRSLGLRARTKLIVTVLISLGLWWVATKQADLPNTLRLRVVDYQIDLGLFYPVVIYLVVAGTTSGVNLTDGLDGLAAGCAAIVLLAFVGITFITTGQRDLALFAACGVGACVGFLWFNSLPGQHLHGGHRLARPRWRDRRSGRDDQDRDPADHPRRDLRDRGAVGRDPGVLVPDLPQAGVPDGARAPPLRTARLVGDEDHPALLDRRRRAARRSASRSTARRSDGRPPGPMKPRPPLPPGPYLVVGLARSGVAAALALRARGEEVIGCDAGAPEAGRLRAAGVEVHLQTQGSALVARARTLVKSPGVPREAPVVAAARERGTAVIGELELAWRLIPNDFIAVTGTNGKTTTTELIGHIHREAGLPVAVAGNVGAPVADLASRLAPDVTVVCEASSFQLEDTLEFAPEGAVLLNLAEDHLDRHGSFEAYVAAKLQAFRRQGNDDLAVFPCDLAVEDLGGCARRVCFGRGAEAELADRAGQLWWADEPLLAGDEIGLRGRHNRDNAMAAAAVALARGVEPAAVSAALRDFAGVPHRLEQIAERDGVLYVNDSKATNPASTGAALASFEPGTIHLIAGGRAKGGFAELVAPVRAGCAAVYLIGEAAEALADALAPAGVPLQRCGALERAVAAAREAARPGEVVLLSPACASYDQYEDFEARGEHFRELVGEAA